MARKITKPIKRETSLTYFKRPICFVADGFNVSLWQKGLHTRFDIDWVSIYELAMKLAYVRSLQDKPKKGRKRRKTGKV